MITIIKPGSLPLRGICERCKAEVSWLKEDERAGINNGVICPTEDCGSIIGGKGGFIQGCTTAPEALHTGPCYEHSCPVCKAKWRGKAEIESCPACGGCSTVADEGPFYQHKCVACSHYWETDCPKCQSNRMHPRKNTPGLMPKPVSVDAGASAGTCPCGQPASFMFCRGFLKEDEAGVFTPVCKRTDCIVKALQKL